MKNIGLLVNPNKDIDLKVTNRIICEVKKLGGHISILKNYIALKQSIIKSGQRHSRTSLRSLGMT
jgi:hypothetical protein